MSNTELNVVCGSCGAEVSPYVTECPYCGARLRKRAPDLERRDGGLEPKLSGRERRRRKKRESRQHRAARAPARPWATILLLAVPVVLLLARVGADLTVAGSGGLVVPFDQQWWRFPAAPFVYGSIGYLFAVSLALVIFVPAIERRLGTVATLALLVGCGALGMIAAAGIESAFGGAAALSGGNGVALGAVGAWYLLARAGRDRSRPEPDPAGVVVCAAVLLLLPLVVDEADFWAGLAGGLVGVLAGFVAGKARS